jgi:DNA-directed RNA polymerase specialized sigma subunit
MTTNACSRISGMPHSPTPDRQPIQTAIAKIVDLEQAVNSDIDSLVELKQDILTRIAMVKNSRHRKLLILRFIERKTWLDIAIDMRYTERHVRRMGNEALESFESIISCPLVSG